MNEFERGSEWRIWDLHIHTPGTKKNDQFTGSNIEDKWTTYINDMNSSQKEIAAVAITDYFSIDNYFIFKEALDSNHITKGIKLVLPNIELRITPVTGAGTPINIHCIFNPQIDQQINDRFLSKLKFDYGGSNYSATRDELIRLGKKHCNNPWLDDEAAYISGVNQYVIAFNALKSVFDKDPELRGNTIIVVSNSTNDGASGVAKHKDYFVGKSESQLDATRRSIYQFSDAIFSSNESDRNYFLGLGVDAEPIVINKCGSLKPCLHGCDAHSNEKIFNPDANRHCWLKADLTFEGLKQIICEPEERVCIQENSPDDTFSKMYIDCIEANGDIIKDEVVSFNSVKLNLNKNLVAIIGGRGTGKSLLLDGLLKSFDLQEAPGDARFEGVISENITSTIQKADGIKKVSSLGDRQAISYLHVRQGEIKDIAQSPAKLSEKIKELLSISSDSEDTERDYAIKSLFDEISEYKQWSKEKDEQGRLRNTGEYCTTGIKHYKKLIESITSESTKEAVAKYKENQNLMIKDAVQTTGINEKISEIQRFQVSLNDFVGGLNTYYNFPPDAKLTTWDLNNIIEPLERFRKTLEERRQASEKGNEKIKEDLIKAGINQDISTLLDKVGEYQNNLGLFEKHQEIIIQKQKKYQENITQRNLIFQVVQVKLQENEEKIKSEYRRIREGKDSWSIEQKNLVNKILDEIDINAEIIFNRNKFYHGIWEILNGTKFRDSAEKSGPQKMQQMLGVNDLADFYSLAGGKDICRIGDIKSTIDEICDNDDFFISYKAYNLYEYIYLEKYFKDYLQVIPRLTYKGKPPEKLSVGQRGTFYLCLRLATDPFGSPFVFDQPEDDLDNEFITDTLVPIFKEIKKYRQVIIATHNANLVVNAPHRRFVP